MTIQQPDSQQPDISVVIGAQNACNTITLCLQSLLRQAHQHLVEIIVVDGSTDGTADLVTAQFPQVVLIHSPNQWLVPQLWGAGIQRAKAPIVAITTAHCIPAENWITNILNTANTQLQFAGYGGGILPPSNGAPKDWAVYFSRYSAFMPPIVEGTTAEIAGDNAAYRKAALDKYWKQPEHGFWETLFHHELRQHGGNLYLSSTIEVELGNNNHSWYFFQARFRHGYHYGSTRPETSRVGRLIRIVAAPALMPFLVLRIGLRVAKQRPDWMLIYILALPWLATFLSAWALGEVRGYLWHRSYTPSDLMQT
jgi:glycosyltransferase involved in cell wall biosynthesis